MTRVLVDTSVWIDHLHLRDEQLAGLLDVGLVVTHPMVIGELALGTLRDRSTVLRLLAQLSPVQTAFAEDVLALVEARRLHGQGLSLVDAHLLASALITGDVRIWTRDRRLATVAHDAAVGWQPPPR